MKARFLKKGEEVRLERGGPLWRVEDVNVCAATVRRLHAEPKPVTIDGRTFFAHKGETLRISPTSGVFRDEEPEPQVAAREELTEMRHCDVCNLSWTAIAGVALCPNCTSRHYHDLWLKATDELATLKTRVYKHLDS
jgi:hypothetical protein